MTSAELIEALARTGTGAGKLAAARRALERSPTLEPAALVAEMAAAGLAGKPAWGEGTVEKARKLLAGAGVKDFLGVPPPNAEEGKIARLGEKIAEKMAEVVAERYELAQANQVGNPAAHKPAAANQKK